MRTIRVTGKGQLRVKPDQTRITLSLGGYIPSMARHFAGQLRTRKRSRIY